MNKQTILVTDYVFSDFEQERKILAEVGAELKITQCKTIAELKPHLAGVHGLLNTYLPGIGPEVFDAAPDLKAVVRYGIGLDTIDIPAATYRGIMVANVPDYCINEVADHALAHFLALARKIPFSDRKVKTGEWSLAYVKPMKALVGMRAGIIGFGRIGRAIAARLKVFGVEVVFHDPMISAEVDGCRPVTFDAVLATCDAIFVQCPSSKATRHLLDRTAFGKMSRQPLVINCARGEVVDTDALVWALQNGKVSGAGLDVLEDESIVKTQHPLKGCPNVTITPHSAWYSEAAIPALQRRAAEEMAKAIKGDRPSSLVNPEVMERVIARSARSVG
jgi:D-3-phosphoglycerate dehydrogenase